MKLKNFIRKYACSMTAFMLTLVAMDVSSRYCYFIFYQPEAPENLSDFSRNK